MNAQVTLRQLNMPEPLGFQAQAELYGFSSVIQPLYASVFPRTTSWGKGSLTIFFC